MPRQSPKARSADRDSTFARAGNYAAPVDTTGMDSSMKKTLDPNKKKAKKPGLINAIKAKMGIKY